MAPFLYTELSDILKTLMSMFVKEEVMLSCQQVTAIDAAKKENLKFSKQVSLGYSTRAALHNANASQLQYECCKKDCLHFLQTLCTKILGISFCDPTLISKSVSISLKRLRAALEIRLKEISEKFDSPVIMKSVKKYSRNQGRLDIFWSTLLLGFSVPDLLNFVKKVLILSHGNDLVERGFSVNKELVVENDAQKSLVAQRQVYDGVVSSSGRHDLKVCKEMIHCARNAKGLYGEALRLKVFQSKEKIQEVFEKEPDL
ncbi:hypothetical protein PR048_019056 [Dryococelus australis]|uniref:Uncharacterized protein n=1 Tax=Dryococelus australis TaxID=614101 RepID=A0ABQ9H2H1_9NEOP|nr:hypothetical protein PR048_019056 [Dryococelus australis]